MFLAIGSAAIAECGGFTVLFGKLLVVQLRVISGIHDGRTIVSEANNLVVDRLSLVELSFKDVGVFFAESVITVLRPGS